MKLSILLRKKRKAQNLKMREVTMQTGIDQSILSKLESGDRIPTEEQIRQLSICYQMDVSQLRKEWLAQKLYVLASRYPEGFEALKVAESRVEYLISDRSLQKIKLSNEIKARLKNIDKLKQQWIEQKPLNKLQLRKMEDYFRIEYTFESNRIEGNTLTLQETELVVNQGITVSGKSMKEHLEAINHAEAAAYIVDLVQLGRDFNKRVLLELHGFVLRGIDRENAGKYRQVPVRISGSEHLPPQPFLLDKLMEDYFLHYENNRNILHAILLAAEMHERLVSIHPFIDGNGRTARLVMNLILLRNGYTIANLKGDNSSRMEYYKSLQEVQKNASPNRFYTLIMDTVSGSLQAHLELTQ